MAYSAGVARGTDPRGLCRTQMCDVVNPVLVKANRFHQINLYFVSCGDTSDQIFSRRAHRLRYGQDGRDVIAWMRIIRSEKSVMHV